MNITISSGVGTGPTTLAAFDGALYAAGIANYNLLILSSVIPPATTIIQNDESYSPAIPGEWGDRLYVVMAEQRTDVVGQEVWAGIGWVQDKETGKGLFVEHEGQSEAAVKDSITASLKALMETRGIDFGAIQMRIQGAICEGEPVCAMVAAAYQTSDWNNNATLIEGIV